MTDSLDHSMVLFTTGALNTEQSSKSNIQSKSFISKKNQ